VEPEPMNADVLETEHEFDVAFARSHFPALETPWALLDNAGGSVPPQQVVRRITEHLQRRPVQLGATYDLSREAGESVAAGRRAAATLLGAEPNEVVLGPSATVLLGFLARALRPLWRKEDEVVVTNLDHESNVGPWRGLERTGIEVKEWRFRKDTMRLHVEDLEPLLSDRTRLVAFTHCSNLVGTVHDVESVVSLCREKDVLTCVDGIAYAPHRSIDVAELDVDFYAVSLYKVFGPHVGALFGRAELWEKARGCSHFFVEQTPAKFEPGNPQYELVAGLSGILEYFDAIDRQHFALVEDDRRAQVERCFELMGDHERVLLRPLLEVLRDRPGVHLLGQEDADSDTRVPIVSFHVEDRDSSEIPPLLDERRLGTRFGHFYAIRSVRELGLEEKNGVVRISLAHYNEPREIERLVEALDEILPPRR